MTNGTRETEVIMFWIMTTSEKRLAEWNAVLGMDRLPVTTQRPIMIRRGQWKRPYFMIDANRLGMIERMRLIGYLWRTKHVSTVTAIMMVDSGVLVDGRDCEVVEPVEDNPPAYLYWYAYAP
jgi:hypothetical protein